MSSQPERTGTLPDALRCKVLVVDDERDVADLAGALLLAHGFAVTVVYSALDALQVLQNEPDIDAVFSDVMMPGMTGLQLAGAVRKLCPGVRITLTSGYTPPDLLAEPGGHYQFTTKPYNIDTVIELLMSKPVPAA